MPRPSNPVSLDVVKRSKRSARRAGLRWADDHASGITRKPYRNGFGYHRPNGGLVRDETTLARIRSLAIPPAWKDVWISRSPLGHIQATGRDAAGRKQYRYHARWREVRDETKYSRMALFGALLPKMRARVRRDLALPGLPRSKVLAAIVRLMETTHFRVGNEEYVRQNGSYGVTTLRDKHVEVRRGSMRFSFRAKSGKMHDAEVDDPRLARIVRRCRDLPGQKLFQYLNDQGRRRTVTSTDVNEYLREISGEDFTAKDFRTWAGTLWAARCLRRIEPPQSTRQTKARTVEVVREVAEELGNTAAVCRKSYIHPAVLDAVGDVIRLKYFSAGGVKSPTGVRSWERFLVRYIKNCERPRVA